MSYKPTQPTADQLRNDWLRIEMVTTSVGFDDLLDHVLPRDMSLFDTSIVVTSHNDLKTQAVVRKHGAVLVLTDLFQKDGRNFNKGAAINNGFDYFRFYGWRCFKDADIVLPSGFRQRLFNLEHLDADCLYGMDRMDINGDDAIKALLSSANRQHHSGMILDPSHGVLGHRYIEVLNGPGVLGFFSLWNAKCQKPYPYSLGTASHDDISWSNSWPKAQRRHLTSSIAYHLHPGGKTKIGENWDGRKMPRLKG